MHHKERGNGMASKIPCIRTSIYSIF